MALTGIIHSYLCCSQSVRGVGQGSSAPIAQPHPPATMPKQREKNTAMLVYRLRHSLTECRATSIGQSIQLDGSDVSSVCIWYMYVTMVWAMAEATCEVAVVCYNDAVTQFI